MYKLITLGKSFIFISEGIYKDKTLHGTEESAKKLLSDKGMKIYVSIDERYDYRLYADITKDIFKPDFERAIMVFLYCVKGLPRSDYEIFSVKDKNIIKLPKFNGICGGNVGKCKLLCPYSFENTEEYPFEFCLVETAQGNYIVLICDRPECVELSKISSRILGELSPSLALRGSISLSFCENEVYIETKNFDGSDLPDTSAFAAACYVAENTFHVSNVTVRSGELVAFCESSVEGVSVFDISPEVYKII